MQSFLEHFPGLDGAEALFLALRRQPPDAADAVRAALKAAGSDGAAFPDLVATAARLVAMLDAHAASVPEQPYHNRHHFIEATLAMGWLAGAARKRGWIDTRMAALGVVAMLGHDLLHDGSWPTEGASVGALEARSATLTCDCAAAGDVPASDLAVIRYVIDGTEPSLAAENAARASGALPPGPLGAAPDRLRALAVEADLFGSLLPELGWRLGEALAAERAHTPGGALAARFAGRLAFLRDLPPPTPVGNSFGLPVLAAAQLRAFALAAGRLGADGADAAAVALDAMPRADARAMYLAALAEARRPLFPPEPPAADAPPWRGLSLSFTITILTAFTLLFVMVMAVTLAVMQHESRRAAAEAAEVAVTGLADRTAARVEAAMAPLDAALTTVAASLGPLPEGSEPPWTGSLLLQMLVALPQAQAVMLARADGVLIEVLAVDPELRTRLAIPKAARWAMRVAAPGADAPWLFLNAQDGILGRRAASTAPDQRTQIWYRTAMNAEGTATTVVHQLPSVLRPGFAVVRALPGGGAVGFDVTLDVIGADLAGQRASRHGVAFLMDEGGIVLAHSDPGRAVSRTTGEWEALNFSQEPLDQALWTAYATGALLPGSTLALTVDGETWLARLTPLPSVAALPALVVVAAPEADFTGPIARAAARMLKVGLAAALVGLGAIGLTASRVTRPLAALSREAVAIGHLDLDKPLRVRSHITEVASLAGTMRTMKATLRAFGQYVPKDLVRQLVDTGGAARLGGERRVVTVMFTDITGFTTLADSMDANRLMWVMSQYFEQVVTSLMADRATIDKFIGDAIMALWNAPTADPAHAAHACRAALHCRLVCERLEREFLQQAWPPLRTRFGISTGEVAVGNFGAVDRLAYTALGATVNMASRLESLNKYYGTAILVTAATRTAAGPDFVFRRVDRVLPKGRIEPTDIHELLGLVSHGVASDAGLVISPERIAWAAAWDAMVESYLDRRFEEAEERMVALGGVSEDDALRRLYAARIHAFQQRPPPAADWNGVVAFDEK
ncbi:MAG TPA: adenylate/guanylate cyclase domain-containing protein [Acetobacteraceae bacterium]|nr:adenylate/guanylate cyclase domain-containing protein [Acetobacteraceae bacterium]